MMLTWRRWELHSAHDYFVAGPVCGFFLCITDEEIPGGWRSFLLPTDDQEGEFPSGYDWDKAEEGPTMSMAFDAKIACQRLLAEKLRAGAASLDEIPAERPEECERCGVEASTVACPCCTARTCAGCFENSTRPGVCWDCGDDEEWTAVAKNPCCPTREELEAGIGEPMEPDGRAEDWWKHRVDGRPPKTVFWHKPNTDITEYWFPSRTE